MTVVPSEKVRRVGMISLGCPKNLVDAEIMLGQLQADAGHVEITNDLDEADVVIVNTCGFIDAAKQESIDTILEIAEKKGRGVERLIVTGCMVQKYRTELQDVDPGDRRLRRARSPREDHRGRDRTGRGRPGADAPQDVAAAVRRLPARAHAGHRARVSQGQRRLLESVHVLLDPADARQVPLAQPRRASCARRRRCSRPA